MAAVVEVARESLEGTLVRHPIFVFNGDGLRVQKWARPAPTQPIEKTDYVWDVASPLPVVLQETTAATTVKYVHGLDLISAVEGTATGYYLYDGLGSTRALADDQGAVTATYDYDVFGALRSSTGASEQAFRFTGEQQDPDVSGGLYYLRARYYDPSTGRFLSKDPVPYLQRYAYAGNNPVNAVDPSGETAALAIAALRSCLRTRPCQAAAVAVFGETMRLLNIQLSECLRDNINDPDVVACQPTLAALRVAEAGYVAAVAAQVGGPAGVAAWQGITHLNAEAVDDEPAPRKPDKMGDQGRANKAVEDVARELGLTKGEKRTLHEELTRLGRSGEPVRGFNGIMEVAKGLFPCK